MQIFQIIVTITKFSNPIGSSRAYLTRNWRAITWVFNYRYPTPTPLACQSRALGWVLSCSFPTVCKSEIRLNVILTFSNKKVFKIRILFRFSRILFFFRLIRKKDFVSYNGVIGLVISNWPSARF